MNLQFINAEGGPGLGRGEAMFAMGGHECIGCGRLHVLIEEKLIDNMMYIGEVDMNIPLSGSRVNIREHVMWENVRM